MKKLIKKTLFLSITLPMVAQADPILTGDTRLACEAILCLSSPHRPGECNSALRKYFSIRHKKWHKTVRARHNFLKLCPTSNEPGMPSLVSAIAEGAGRCDADFLNQNHTKKMVKRVCIMNEEQGEYSCHDNVINTVIPSKPHYCQIYDNHEYTDFNTKYIGKPNEGGFWADGFEYDGKLSEYNANQAKIKAQDDSAGLNSLTKYKVYRTYTRHRKDDGEYTERYWTGKYAEAPKRTIQYFEYKRKPFFGFSSNSDK
ncbi:TrbM/KikA/MpfK family conjugal transfer protein (plasmid) [Pasteurella multocida]|uniref:TrbM/KikA/MpfK family conjugal transfer protein n=1 Tax=Pasteurella multocida TaxID=747 RepID=UPI002ED45D74|nr:TrbM/KikA/MpfK family conjugal transfer protein [Pasteurella multocida]